MDEALTLLLEVVAVAWCFVLPGWVLAMPLDFPWSRLVRIAVGTTLGLVVVPIASFCAAWMLGTNVRPTLVAGTAGAIALAGLGCRFAARVASGKGAR